MRPDWQKAEALDTLPPYSTCDIVVGDLNARHPRWGSSVDGTRNNHANFVYNFFYSYDMMIPSVPTHDGLSVINLCPYKWAPTKYRLSHLAGLPLAAQISNITVDTYMLPPPKPAYKRVYWNTVSDALGNIKEDSLDVVFSVRQIVDGLPRMIHGQDRCHWWNDDLEQMRDAVCRLRRITTRDKSRRDDYILARNVYRLSVVQARYDNLKTMLATTTDTDIF